MLFTEIYSKIKKELDSEYIFPKSKKFHVKEFQKCRWQDTRAKHLCSILWVLASYGPSTITEIVEKDGYSQSKPRKKTRWDTYNRKIDGNQKSVNTLTEKGLVYKFDEINTSKPTQRYSLTSFGAFYAMSLFSDRSLVILDKIASSHDHLLPLVFGKWDIIKKNTGPERRILYTLANITSSDNVAYDPLLNRRAFSIREFKNYGIYTNEITMYFFSRLSNVFQPKKFSHVIKIDDEIYKWYSKCVNNLLLVNDLDKIHIQYVKSAMEGKIEIAKKLLKKHSEMQGINEQ